MRTEEDTMRNAPLCSSLERDSFALQNPNDVIHTLNPVGLLRSEVIAKRLLHAYRERNNAERVPSLDRTPRQVEAELRGVEKKHVLNELLKLLAIRHAISNMLLPQRDLGRKVAQCAKIRLAVG